MNRIVVCAAIRSASGDLICAPRHFDETMRQQIRLSVRLEGDWKTAEQGFVDQYGEFLSREEAYIVALSEGQIVRRCGGDKGKLYSENLY